MLTAAYSPQKEQEEDRSPTELHSSATKNMLGRSTQRYLSPLAREATFFETRLPNEDRNYSNSPAARHAMGDGSLDPNQTFFGRTFNRKLKMRDTFTKLFPAYEHGQVSNCTGHKITSKNQHYYPTKNDIGGAIQEIDRTYTHKKDDMKNFHEAMLRIQNMRRPTK